VGAFVPDDFATWGRLDNEVYRECPEKRYGVWRVNSWMPMLVEGFLVPVVISCPWEN
jgi:hypothetical protein